MKPNNNNNNNSNINNNNNPKNEYQQILRKIESQSKQQKQQRTINIMRGESSKNKSYQPINIMQRVNMFFNQQKTMITRYYQVKQNRHTAIMTIFLLFSSYIAWKIEKKYDTLKKRAQRTQTFKQRQVEQENEYIERMLRKKEFESVPIPNELEELNKYRFQQNEQSGGLVIDTKQDLFDLIAKDKNKDSKRSAEQIYEDEVKRAKQTI